MEETVCVQVREHCHAGGFGLGRLFVSKSVCPCRMSFRLSLVLYNLLLPLGLLLMLPSALRKMRQRGGSWWDMRQRLGLFPREARAALARLPVGRDRLWIHAVSVGEVGIATKLISRLLAEQPQLGIVITTTTPTGHAMALDSAAGRDGRVVVLYSPLDLPGVAERFLEMLAPSQLVLVEAEVWPNLVSAATHAGVPISLVNARLSPRTERRYQKLSGIVKPLFAHLRQVMVQEPEDVARWTGLGLAAKRVHHTGSIKFDPQGAAANPAQVAELKAVLAKAGIGENQPVLLLASTHPGEEKLLAEMTLRLRKKHADLALLIVPRHVERAADLVQELGTLGMHVERRSQVTRPTLNLLVDTTGELRAWQELATLVVVGKSFLATGGQNPAEAVMARKPVLFGPHMENFLALVDLLLAGQGAVQVADVAALEKEVHDLLIKPARRDTLGSRGQAALARHEGATAKTVALLTGVAKD